MPNAEITPGDKPQVEATGTAIIAPCNAPDFPGLDLVQEQLPAKLAAIAPKPAHTFEEVLAAVLADHQRRWANATSQQYRWAARFITDALGQRRHLPIHAVDAGSLAVLKDKLHEYPRNHKSARQRVRLIRTLLRELVERGLTTECLTFDLNVSSTIKN